MTVAQGINKITAYQAQTALGVPAIGAGGQILRRKTSVADISRATYVNDEIVQHQQSTGVNLGTAASSWNFDGLLSPGTYSKLMQGLLRKIFTATTPVTAAITLAGTAGAWTLTDAANTFLTAGIKIGDIVRITAGSFVNPVNLNNNVLVTNVTQTVITGATLNNSVLIAEGPIAASTITVIGKKCIVPQTGHTDTLFTVEEWYKDLNQSEVFPDIRVGQCDIGMPATGNATIKLVSMGLGVRTGNVTQQMTAPAAATTFPVLTSVRGLLRVNNAPSLVVTGVTLAIKTPLTQEGPVVGSNYAPDMARGRIEVSGSFTSLFDGITLRALFDAETITSLICVMAADTTNGADFVGITLSSIKLTSAAVDDGEKAILRTYAFTASMNVNGGATVANDITIISVQDSQAA